MLAEDTYEAPEMARRAALVIGSNSLHRALWREHPKTMRQMFIAGRCEAPHNVTVTVEPAPRVEPPPPLPPVSSPPKVGIGQATIQRVADAMGCSYGEIIGTGRAYLFVAARSLVARLLRDRGWSTSQIGRVLRRDHSTVVNMLQRWPHWAETYPDAAAHYASEGRRP